MWRRPWRWMAIILVALLSATGIPVQAADEPGKASLHAVAVAALSDSDVGLGMLEARVPLSKNIFATAAPTAVLLEGNDAEYQLRTGATLLLDLGPLQVDDRNLWVFSDSVTTRYRNRLRLTAPVSVGGNVLRLQVFNEVFYERGGAGWFRNVVGGGVGFDFNRHVAAEALVMGLDDDHRERAEIFVLSVALRIR